MWWPGAESTTDTRIFSTAESAVSPRQPEDRQGISRGLTEPRRPTESILNRELETLTEAPPERSGSTAYRRPDRTPTEPRAGRATLRDSGSEGAENWQTCRPSAASKWLEAEAVWPAPTASITSLTRPPRAVPLVDDGARHPSACRAWLIAILRRITYRSVR